MRLRDVLYKFCAPQRPSHFENDLMLMSTPLFSCVPPLPEMKHHGVVVFSERNQTDLPRKTACTRPVDDCWG